MKLLNYLIAILLTASISGCDDPFEDNLVKDNKPEIPVTFSGATTYGFNPYYTVPNGGTVTITLTIPESAPVKIQGIDQSCGRCVGYQCWNPGNRYQLPGCPHYSKRHNR